MSSQWEDNQLCFVCGKKNAQGFQLDFKLVRPGLLASNAVIPAAYQGFRGVAHGGMVATLLDEMMVNLLWMEGIRAVTVEMNVRFKKPVKTGEKLYLEGRLVGQKKRIYSMASTVSDAKGGVLASAEGKCLTIASRGKRR